MSNASAIRERRGFILVPTVYYEDSHETGERFYKTNSQASERRYGKSVSVVEGKRVE